MKNSNACDNQPRQPTPVIHLVGMLGVIGPARLR
jgi:hypothetical protein